MDKAIKKGIEGIKKKASKEEASLVRMDKKRDAKCDKGMKMKGKK